MDLSWRRASHRVIRAIRAPVITKDWPGPRRTKLITAAIVAVLAAPALYLLGLWAFFVEWLGMGWRFLVDSTLVPNWMLLLLVISALIVCGILGTSLRPPRETADSNKEEPPR